MMLEYQCRMYHSLRGRWMSRDPACEKHGDSLNRFCDNMPTVVIDSLGLTSVSINISLANRDSELGPRNLPFIIFTIVIDDPPIPPNKLQIIQLKNRTKEGEIVWSFDSVDRTTPYYLTKNEIQKRMGETTDGKQTFSFGDSPTSTPPTEFYVAVVEVKTEIQQGPIIFNGKRCPELICSESVSIIAERRWWYDSENNTGLAAFRFENSTPKDSEQMRNSISNLLNNEKWNIGIFCSGPISLNDDSMQ